jgi:hypothetical protein
LNDDSLGDTSVLAERAALQDVPALTAQSRDDQERDEVTAALDTSSDEDESELESDQENIVPKAMPTNHATKIMQPLPSGERDPVRRLKHTFDAAATDALYGSDSEAEEPDLNEDDQDDQERWERIPSHLKGKGRAQEDSEDEDWLQSSDREDDEPPTKSRSTSSGREIIEISDSDEEESSGNSPRTQQTNAEDEVDELDYEHAQFVEEARSSSDSQELQQSSSPELDNVEPVAQRQGGS